MDSDIVRTMPPLVPIMQLDKFRNEGFDRGATRATEFLWVVLSELIFSGPLPGSGWRSILLRAFGAKIAKGVVIKPRVRIKFPWRLEIGAYSWIGEGVWIDNLAPVRIGSNVCVSQAAYLCTGNHDWASNSFDLITEGITIEDHCWVGACAAVAPGVHMHAGAVLGLGAVARGEMQSWTIYAPASAIPLRPRPRQAGR